MRVGVVKVELLESSHEWRIYKKSIFFCDVDFYGIFLSTHLNNNTKFSPLSSDESFELSASFENDMPREKRRFNRFSFFSSTIFTQKPPRSLSILLFYHRTLISPFSFKSMTFSSTHYYFFSFFLSSKFIDNFHLFNWNLFLLCVFFQNKKACGFFPFKTQFSLPKQ